MKKGICISVVPFLLLIYFFCGGVYRIDSNEVWTLFVPLEWDCIVRYQFFSLLNAWFYTVYQPFLLLFRSDICLACCTTILDSRQDFCNQSPCYEQVSLLLKFLFFTFSTSVLFCFHYLSTLKHSDYILLYVPLGISVSWGLVWLGLLNADLEWLVPIFFFYLLLGMFWGIVSQGTYWLLEFFEKKRENRVSISPSPEQD